MAERFRVRIYTPEKVAFETKDAESLVLAGLDGEVGVMAHHMPAVFAVDSGAVRVKIGEDWLQFVTTEGFADVNYNRAYVFVDYCVPEENAEAAAAELERLKARDRRSVREHRRNAVTLARALAELHKKDKPIN